MGAALPLDPDDSSQRYDYAERRPLAALLDEQDPMPAARCLELIDVALTLVAEMYVHLPLKRALYVIDPESRLRLYRRTVDEEAFFDRPIDALAFHTEMAGIFNSLHDRHTRYLATGALRDWDGFLPVRVEEYSDPAPGPSRFTVSSVDKVKAGANEVLGADVTHWNGVPIELAVQRLAEMSGGANAAARRARGIEALTRRPLTANPPPDEDWVEARLVPKGGGKPFVRRFTWSAGLVSEAKRGPRSGPADRERAEALGLDDDARRVALSKRVMVTKPVETLAPFRPFAEQGYAQPMTIGNEDYGYLRLHSFVVEDDIPFVKAVAETLEVLKGLPVAGVIVDIRGNPGGSIIAAERLLQLFADAPITREPLQLRISRFALRLTNDPVYAAWERSVRQGLDAGGGYSAGFPCCTSREDAHDDVRRVYDGPAILVVDALTYSAAEFFAAGWQDNAAGRAAEDEKRVGRVLGTAPRTGGGGATVDHYQTLRTRLGEPPELPSLDGGDPFSIAVSRSVRVRENNGVLVEDFGVEPGEVYQLTREDVMGSNRGLLLRAAEMLSTG
jgi:Peptidase family S41